MRILRTRPISLVGWALAGWVAVGGAWSAGQAAKALGTAATDPYAAESFVLERSEAVYRYAADGTGSRMLTLVARIQSEAALRDLGVVNLAYAGNSERVEIVYARVRHADGSVVETPVSEAIEMAAPVTREAPFYSDLKQKQLPIRSLRVGDKLEWQARIVRTRAEAANEFWGQESFSVEGVDLSQTLELRIPKDKYVRVWTAPDGRAGKAAETVEGEERVYRWQFSQLKPTVGAAAEAEKEAKAKRVRTAAEELEETEGKLPDVAWTTFKSWEAVGQWYRGLEGDRMVADPAVKAKVAELTAGKATEQQKVEAVYNYVGTQLRYIGVAFGIGRYQPHQATEVLENQYGDCKDKHTLLAAMLGALGLHPDAALVGVGIRFNEEVPSPGAFNHLITRVAVEGRETWLDTTSEVAPYRVLLAVVRDRRTLVVPESGEAKLERTPAELPFAAYQTLDAVGSLDTDGLSNSKMVLTLRGDDEVLIRAVLRQVPAAQYDNLVQKISEGMGFGGTVTHAVPSRAEDTSGPLTIRYDYKREKVGDWDTLRTLTQVMPVAIPILDVKDPPVRTLVLGVPQVYTSTSAMKLPEGWRAELPEAQHVKSKYATYDQTYRFEKGTLYAERRLAVLTEKIPVAEWKSYLKWTTDADLAHEQYVQLRRAGGGKTVHDLKSEKADDPAPGEAANESAAKLIAKALAATKAFDLEGAKTMLDEAKALNPREAGLWNGYALIEMQRGAPSAAAEDFKKEAALHPEDTRVYAALASIQRHAGQLGEAKETLKTWAALDERNADPDGQLAAMLLAEGNAAEAVGEAKKALLRTSDGDKNEEALELLLGRSQMKAGMTKQGHETLKLLLERTEDSGMMNNAAYELADAGFELPLAESSTRTALGKMEEESKAWTLDENPKTLQAKSQTITATWDTLGWILFREGRFAEAETYVKAAWLNRQTSEVGEHLAEIALTKGDRNAALNWITLAIPVARSAEATRLTARAAALRAGGAKSRTDDAKAALQKMRVLPLGAANGLNGTVEYRMLVSDGKVERVEASGEKQMAGGVERLMGAKFPGWFPAGSQANLVKSAMLNCHSGVCELVVLP